MMIRIINWNFFYWDKDRRRQWKFLKFNWLIVRNYCCFTFETISTVFLVKIIFFSRPSTQFVWLTGLSSGFDLVENNKWLASFFLFNKNEELQSWKKRFFFDWELKEFSSSSFIHDKTIFITNHHPTRKKNFKQSASLERNEKIRKKN